MRGPPGAGPQPPAPLEAPVHPAEQVAWTRQAPACVWARTVLPGDRGNPDPQQAELAR